MSNTEEENESEDEYTTEDLLQIFNLGNNPSIFQINDAANSLIAVNKTKGKNDLVTFLTNARDKLLSEFSVPYTNNNDELNNENTNLGNWYQNQYLTQSNQEQVDKITNRKQQVQTWTENGHFQMKRNQLGVTNGVQVPFAQDVLNPNLRNMNTQFIVLDSKFRQTILPYNATDADAPSSSTNYAINLSENLTNVTSIKLQYVQIPNTWYRFSLDQGNTCFKAIDVSGTYNFTLPEGNYTPSELASQLIDASNWDVVPGGWSANYNSNTHKIQFVNSNDISFNTSDCSNSCINVSYDDQSLLWSLGLRDFTTVFPSASSDASNNFPAVVNTFGPSYFAIILDDFNQNRQNQGLVNVSNVDSKLSLPSYYNHDLTFDCSNNGTTKNPAVGPSAPRQITRNQIYSINQIVAARSASKTRNYGVNSSDIFAVIPIPRKTSEYDFDQPYTYVPFNSTYHERNYFGPVDINRMRLRLIDDKGNTVNLNGGDWSVMLIAESLYQY